MVYRKIYPQTYPMLGRPDCPLPVGPAAPGISAYSFIYSLTKNTPFPTGSFITVDSPVASLNKISINYS